MKPTDIKLVILFLFLSPAASVAEQMCRTAINPTSASDQFVSNPDGSATHLSTGLTWQRCLVGQSFEDNGTALDATDDMCLGAPTVHTWERALQLQDAASGWRLPNLKEVESIIELQCMSPALNLDVFPNDNSATLWSSSPSAIDPTNSWAVRQEDGATLIEFRTNSLAARLVRDP